MEERKVAKKESEIPDDMLLDIVPDIDDMLLLLMPVSKSDWRLPLIEELKLLLPGSGGCC